MEIQLRTTMLDHHDLQVTDTGTWRKFSRIFVESWIERRMLGVRLEDQRIYSVDYSCRQRWNQQFILAADINKIWSRARTRTSKGWRRDSISLWGWLRNTHSKLWIYLLWCVTSIRRWQWPCAMIKESGVGESKGACLLRFSLVPNWVRVAYFPRIHTPIEILRQVQKGLKPRQINPEQFEGIILFVSMFNDIFWTKEWVTTDKIVMWVIRCSIVNCDYFKTQIFLETLKIRNQPQGFLCISLSKRKGRRARTGKPSMPRHPEQNSQNRV